MPPTRLPSTLSYPIKITSRLHSSLTSRSLATDTQSHPSRSRKSIFSALLGTIASLAVIEGVMRSVMGIWNFVHPLHLRNTAIAQHEIDQEYMDYHNGEWAEKLKAADLKMVKLMAKEKPDLFVRNFVLGGDKTSQERRLMTGILQRYNPEFYEMNLDALSRGENSRMEMKMKGLKMERLNN